MPKTFQRSISPQPTPLKRLRKPASVRIEARVEQFDPPYRPGRRSRDNIKPSQPAEHADNKNMPKLGAKGSRPTSLDASRRPRSSATTIASHASTRLTRTGRISKAKKGQAVHDCDICGKVYTRAEHLRRHQLNHKSPSLTCPLTGCAKQFHRNDLLDRHMEEHAASNQNPVRSLSGDASTSEPPPGPSPLPGPLLFHSPSRTSTYPDPSLNTHRSMEPPANIRRERTYSAPAITHIYTSPIMPGNPSPHQPRFGHDLHYTWTSAPPTTYPQSPYLEPLQTTTPVSGSSYDSLRTRTPHVDVLIQSSTYHSYGDAHPVHHETYPFVSAPQYREALYPPPLDPTLVQPGVGEGEVLVEYFGEQEQAYRGLGDTEHRYHGV